MSSSQAAVVDEHRSARADGDGVASLRPFFEPRTVAVIGAGRHRGGVGAEIFHNLAACGFRGRTVPVNPHAREIDGVTAYASVADVPGSVDLAIIAVPAHRVAASVDECVTKGVPAVVVISAGFGETGEEGRASEAALRTRVRAAGARMIGPNCMGVLNTDPAIRLNATFSPIFPPPGRVALSSQSGALGLAVLDYARRLNLGMSSFVSVGNKADVSTNDLIEFWADDPRTDVILLYVESFGNPRRFSQIARRVARLKPIIAVKAGRSPAGARAAASHTGALATSDAMVDALFRESGVIRTDTLEELFDVAVLLAHQPIPAGPRVAILTNAGGPGILAADACEARGLVLSPLSPETLAALRQFLPQSAGLSNPIDMLATASADHYARAIPLVLKDPAIDSLLTIFIPPLVTDPAGVARAIAAAARGASKPILATFVGAEGTPDALAPVPCYRFPESAIYALATATTYGRWRTSPQGTVPTLSGVDRAAARAAIERAASDAHGWLAPLDTDALLATCGIPRVNTIAIGSEGDAVDTARQLGFPVVLKGAGRGILHKTEAHAVYVNLIDESAVRHAYQILAARRGHDIEQVLMQPMVRDGVEFLVGAALDPIFGHVIVCGTGGTMVEVLRDTTCRLHPLTDVNAQEMIDGLRGAVLLRGFRGMPGGSEPALRDVLLRVSALIEACPEIAELDLNPVMVTATGAQTVDARVRIERPR